MTIDDKVRDKKLQYIINRETAKISALSSGKIDEYDCLPGKEVILLNQRSMTEQDYCIFSFRKSFEKQTNKKTQLRIKE